MTKLKTVQIKGKDYVEVNTRIKYFRQNFKDWSLDSEIVDMTETSIVIKAIVKNSDGRIIATGLAHEDKRDGYINKTSHIENCETSAWGRALGNLGIGIDSSVASYEEVNTAIQKQNKTEVEKAIKKTFNAKPINKPIKQKAKLSSKDSERWEKARNYAFQNGFKSLIELYELSQNDKDLMLAQLWQLCKEYAMKNGVDKLFSVFKMSEEAQQKLIKEIYNEQD